MPPKFTKCTMVENGSGDFIKKWAKEDNMSAEDLQYMVRPFPKRRRKDILNSSLPSTVSEMSLEDVEALPRGNKRINGRTKSDEIDTNASVSSKDRVPSSRLYNKTSRGVVDRSTTLVEKQPTIEDAVYIYRTLMNNGSRPPVFLQRNLVYLPRVSKVKTEKSAEAFERLVERLSSFAAICSHIQLTITNVLNIKMNHAEKLELTIDLYLQKNCYKRRKTDVTTKEKLIKSVKLSAPLILDAQLHSVIIDTDEISSDVGCHHMSSCYLRAKVTITTEKKNKTNFNNSRRTKKKYYVEPPEHKYTLREYTSTLLVYSGGKSYLPNGKQTLFLYEVPAGSAHDSSQYMDWSELNSSPQIVLDCTQVSTRRSARSSPSKLGSSAALAPPPPVIGSEAINGETNGVAPIVPLTNGVSEKLYFVLQYKGASQTTVQVGYTCPFCLRKTRPSNLVFLLKHLRLCHSRLLFLYKETDGEPAIFVAVNVYYDGSYCGNPVDIIPAVRQTPLMQESYKKEEPTRRTPFTEVLNIRANRKPLTLEEFSKPEPLPLVSSGSSLLGHNRLYYHSVTNQPILSNDIGVDSDGEDTEWTRIASSRLIEEFIDVNKGEKELMKLWNNFVVKNIHFISDVQMEMACVQFVQEHSEILSFKLRNNFLCHIATLYDSGVLQTRNIKTIIECLPKKSGIMKGKALANGHHVIQKA